MRYRACGFEDELIASSKVCRIVRKADSYGSETRFDEQKSAALRCQFRGSPSGNQSAPANTAHRSTSFDRPIYSNQALGYFSLLLAKAPKLPRTSASILHAVLFIAHGYAADASHRLGSWNSLGIRFWNFDCHGHSYEHSQSSCYLQAGKALEQLGSETSRGPH